MGTVPTVPEGYLANDDLRRLDPKNIVDDPSSRAKQGKRWCYTSFLDREEPLFGADECRYLIEGREECPTTGRKHIQGFVQFNTNMRFTALKKRYPSQVRFAFCAGNPYQNFCYCSKDGNFIEIGVRPLPKAKSDPNQAFRDAIAAETVEAGLAIIKDQRPRDFLLYFDSLERNLKRAKQEPFIGRFTPGDFNRPLELLGETSQLFTGPSGIGKTQFAICHFSRPLVVSHIDQLRQLSPDHDGIVFDDMSFTHWPIESVIHLLDMDLPRNLHVRYGTVCIPANTKKIFTHNTDNPFYEIEKIKVEQMEAIRRRLKVVYLKDKLF